MIAGVGSPVVQVEEFSELQGEIGRIKSSACSGMSKLSTRKGWLSVSHRGRIQVISSKLVWYT